jgi:uncharacterized membrane protein
MNNKNQPQNQSRQMAMSYSGPLPPANQFAEYERTLPGAADRILALTEKEMEHRHQNEDVIVKKSMSLGGKGQIFAFIISFISMGVILVSILKNQPIAAIAPTIIALTGLSSVFINSLNKRK